MSVVKTFKTIISEHHEGATKVSVGAVALIAPMHTTPMDILSKHSSNIYHSQH